MHLLNFYIVGHCEGTVWGSMAPPKPKQAAVGRASYSEEQAHIVETRRYTHIIEIYTHRYPICIYIYIHTYIYIIMSSNT